MQSTLLCVIVILAVLGPIQALAMAGDRITGRSFATRSEVIARHGMAATSQPLATQVAIDILKQGGTAMDAAIAANALVSFDLSETEDSDKMLKVITADTGTATSSLCFGAALVAAAAANDRVNVITRGIATVAVKGDVTNVAVGDALHLVSTKLEKTAGAAGETPVAVALEAVTTDTTAKVYFTNRF